MKERYTKKQLEELYHCTIFKDTGFDDSHQFWTAHGAPIGPYDEPIFEYADGWTLDELHENIRGEILLPFMTGTENYNFRENRRKGK